MGRQMRQAPRVPCFGWRPARARILGRNQGFVGDVPSEEPGTKIGRIYRLFCLSSNHPRFDPVVLDKLVKPLSSHAYPPEGPARVLQLKRRSWMVLHAPDIGSERRLRGH